MKIRKGDMVKVRSGKDKGRTGIVEYTLSGKNKVLVKGINIWKKAVKKDQSTGSGGIMDITKPIDASKLMVVCPNCSEPSRIGIRLVGNKRVRYCKKCDELISKPVKEPVKNEGSVPKKSGKSVKKKLSKTKKKKE